MNVKYCDECSSIDNIKNIINNSTNIRTVGLDINSKVELLTDLCESHFKQFIVDQVCKKVTESFNYSEKTSVEVTILKEPLKGPYTSQT